MIFKVEELGEESGARTGRIYTPHGSVDTPVFMPVGTKATVKAMTPQQLAQCGTQVVLANTYHLYLRPGDQLIAQLGGLHRFMGWDGPILTDSGGYQIYSLTDLCRIDDDGVTFRSHIDGSEHRLTPQKAISIQQNLGADIIMCLDECPDACADGRTLRKAVRRTTDWAERCARAHSRSEQALFGIVQGGTNLPLRREHLRQTTAIGFDGYALGGLSVGEEKPLMYRVVREIAPLMPRDAPRYLMGLGTPDAVIEAIASGVDMFDSVHATRIARHGRVMTRGGPLTVRNAPYADDPRPLDENCRCRVCRRFSRAYIRHLIKSDEILAYHLTTYHNLWFMHQMMSGARRAIRCGEFARWRRNFYRSYYGGDPPD